MSARKYSGARIGLMRMNRLLKFAQENDIVCTADAVPLLGITNRTAGQYLHRMEDLGLLKSLPRTSAVSPFIYEPVHDAQPLPIPDTPPSARSLSVAERMSRRELRLTKLAIEPCRRNVKVVPAVQLGLSRDPMLQAFFGDWRAA